MLDKNEIPTSTIGDNHNHDMIRVCKGGNMKEITVIAGSRLDKHSERSFRENYEQRYVAAFDQVEYLIAQLDPAEHIIVTGGAAGIDRISHITAVQRGFEAYEMKAPWYLGKHAGFLRNDFMVRIGGQVYTIWDGESRGTADTQQRAIQAGTLRGTLRF